MDNAFGQPQTLVVLGGSSDIARELTKKLCAARAHTVVLAGRNQTLLDEAASEAKDYGATTTDTVLFDAEDPSNAARVVTESFEKIGENVDLVVVAVGLLGDQFEQENDAVAAARVATVNFTWPVAALAEIRRRLVEQGSGRILVMSTVASIRVRRSAYLYGGAKAGLDRLCDGLADSLDGTGVTLQLLRPGVVRTKMTAGLPDIPFTTNPDEVANNIVKGLASGQRVIWSPPLLRYVFAVLRHLPKPLWRKVVDR
ncbi:MAG TPA: SDR family NAD(P)-dependent oxidoreductase [Acidimicrobiales bacterium]